MKISNLVIVITLMLMMSATSLLLATTPDSQNIDLRTSFSFKILEDTGWFNAIEYPSMVAILPVDDFFGSGIGRIRRVIESEKGILNDVEPKYGNCAWIGDQSDEFKKQYEVEIEIPGTNLFRTILRNVCENTHAENFEWTKYLDETLTSWLGLSFNVNPFGFSDSAIASTLRKRNPTIKIKSVRFDFELRRHFRQMGFIPDSANPTFGRTPSDYENNVKFIEDVTGVDHYFEVKVYVNDESNHRYKGTILTMESSNTSLASMSFTNQEFVDAVSKSTLSRH